MEKDEVNSATQAVALRYEEKNVAPKVVAKGRGFVAQNIIDMAQKNAVPVYQNKTLAGMLMAVDLDREIPPDLYMAVAEVLAYVYRMDQKAGRKRPK